MAHLKSENWYVRQQAILSIGWFHLAPEANGLLKVLFTEWDEEVRRSIATLSFMSPNTEVVVLEQVARDLSPKVSRMGNFLLRLREDHDLARFNLKKFREPNKVFFVDGYWRLYQIARNPDNGVQRQLADIITRTDSQPWGQFAKRHIRALSGLTTS